MEQQESCKRKPEGKCAEMALTWLVATTNRTYEKQLPT